jgi:CubicO group peptidase (beta-lactamase class C family)
MKSKNIIIIFFVFNSILTFAQQETKIDSANLAKLIEFSAATFTDEILVMHKNNVVAHWTNNLCDSAFYNTASMVKSWTGLVVGIMIDKELISSEDDLVCQYIPDWEDGCKYDVTIKNLLTMTSGLNRKSGIQGILAEADMSNYATNVSLDTLPNIRFGYSNEGVHLLGMIIENVTSKSANQYFQEVLFEPLGMDSTNLGTDAAGNYVVFGGAKTTINDAVKIGLLMINKGSYRGKQIVSENWIKKSLTLSEKASYYGYLWWLDNNSENINFAAMGDFGQMTIVFPELDLVFMRRQSCNKDISGNMKWMGPDFLNLISSVVKKK